MKILIWRLSSLGDIVKCTSILERVQAELPGAEIHWVIREDFQSLLSDDPRIHQLWIVPRKASKNWLEADLLPKLHHEKFQFMVDAHHSLRSLLASRYLKIPTQRLSKNRWGKNLLFATRFAAFAKPWRLHQSAQELLNPFVGEPKKDYLPKLILKPYQAQNTQSPSIAIIPSAAHANKHWTTDRWLELINRFPEFNIQLFGTPSDQPAQELAQKISPTRLINWIGKLSIYASIQQAASCRFVIGVDTGILHGVEAIGKDVVMLLGPTGAETAAYPFRAKSGIVERNIFCRPCSKDGSAPCLWGLGTRRCMTEITAEDVYQSCLEI